MAWSGVTRCRRILSFRVRRVMKRTQLPGLTENFSTFSRDERAFHSGRRKGKWATTGVKGALVTARLYLHEKVSAMRSTHAGLDKTLYPVFSVCSSRTIRQMRSAAFDHLQRGRTVERRIRLLEPLADGLRIHQVRERVKQARQLGEPLLRRAARRPSAGPMRHGAWRKAGQSGERILRHSERTCVDFLPVTRGPRGNSRRRP